MAKKPEDRDSHYDWTKREDRERYETDGMGILLRLFLAVCFGLIFVYALVAVF